MKTSSFVYEEAFDRNIGWLTQAEQNKLRQSRVAIAGLGGTGGYQAQALARLGVTKFRIADPDRFELTNTNRQLGAMTSTMDHSKVEVIEKMILDINPEAEVKSFPEGVNAANVDVFLKDVNFAIDGIDFFAAGIKKIFFEACYQNGIPALTCAPIGFGASLLIFSPQGVKYDAYFDLHSGMSDEETQMAFAFGLSPIPLAAKYMQRDGINLKNRRASSVVAGLTLVGAVTAAEAVKVLTGKWPVRYAPHMIQLDLLTQQMKLRYYRWGMKSPWQRVKKYFFKKLLAQKTQASSAS